MPRLPDRKSTAKRIGIEDAAVASFLFPWDKVVAFKPCCIEGCEHFAAGILARRNSEGAITCDPGNPAFIYNEGRMPGPIPDPYVGIACPCCVTKLLDRGN